MSIILIRPEEGPVHDFRVGVKRLTALYYFLNRIDTDLKSKQILKPYRSIFKSVGSIRDLQIAVNLILSLEEISTEDSGILVKALKSKIRSDYRSFQAHVRTHPPQSIRTPTVRATGISAKAILKLKPLVLENLLLQILSTEGRLNAKQWHQKRILLKRYHHKMDVFCYCPGSQSDEHELKQVKILEQLLGDWHDRVVTTEILHSFKELEVAAGPVIAMMSKQEKLLLGSARIYLAKFSQWHRVG